MQPQKAPQDSIIESYSEYRSKLILAQYQIPFTEQELALSPEQALKIAEEIGFPVALKACSALLPHKSESGVIELNISNKEQLLKAYEKITDSVSVELEGLLVQKMVFGNRELVMGMTQDPQFGVCVMLGLGGVLAEVFADTCFRAAPFDLIEAKDMIQELNCRKMLQSFRGQAPLNEKALCQSLVGLAQLGLEHPEIKEVDVNPLIIDKNGNIKAVDALVVQEGGHNA